MGGLLDVDALTDQLVKDLADSGRTAYRPKEVVELVQKAAKTLFDRGRKHCIAYGPPPCTNAIAGGGPRRGVRMPTSRKAVHR